MNWYRIHAAGGRLAILWAALDGSKREQNKENFLKGYTHLNWMKDRKTKRKFYITKLST
jgi:hypothetical protein